MLPSINAKIQLIEMPDDPDPIPSGATGTIVNIVELSYCSQIWVDWDPPHDHRSLMLIEGMDKYKVIG